jgi:nucleoid-associated protein YgaU
VRILLGWLLLISLAALAGLVQSRFTESVRAEREEILRARGARTGPDDGWSQVIVGEPSGAEAADIEWYPQPEPAAPQTDPEFEEGAPPELATEADERTWQVRISSGMVLSKLCAEAYGRGTPQIVAAVARYNGLDDADHLAVGDVILLPPYSELYDADGDPLTPLR